MHNRGRSGIKKGESFQMVNQAQPERHKIFASKVTVTVNN